MAQLWSVVRLWTTWFCPGSGYKLEGTGIRVVREFCDKRSSRFFTYRILGSEGKYA